MLLFAGNRKSDQQQIKPNRHCFFVVQLDFFGWIVNSRIHSIVQLSAHLQFSIVLFHLLQLSTFYFFFWSQEGQLVPGVTSPFKTGRKLEKAPLGPSSWALGRISLPRRPSSVFPFNFIDQNGSSNHLVLYVILGKQITGFLVSVRGSP